MKAQRSGHRLRSKRMQRHANSVLFGIHLQTVLGARQLRCQAGMTKTIRLIPAAVQGSF